MSELMPCEIESDTFSDSINHEPHISLLQSIPTTGRKDITILTKTSLSLFDVGME